MATYKDLGFDDFGIKLISSATSAFQDQRKQFSELQLRTLELGTGADPGEILKIYKADGTQIMVVDTTYGWVEIGDETPPTNQDPQVSLYLTKDTDNYYAFINAQNVNSGESASTDFIIMNDSNTSESYEVALTTGYVDLGVNSSGWNDPYYATFDASAEFLDVGDNLYIGTSGTAHGIYFYTGGHDSKDYIRVQINSEGVLIPFQATETTEPAYVLGGLYFNTDKNKMYIGGADGWEELTSTVVPSASASPSISPSASPSVSPSEP